MVEREDRNGERTARRGAASVVALVLMAGVLGGCAARTYHGMLVEENAISQAMVAVQQAERGAFTAHVYDTARHERYAATIAAILNEAPSLDRAMRDWRQGQAAPPVIAQATGRLQKMLVDVGTLEVPPSRLLGALEHAIGLLTVRPGG